MISVKNILQLEVRKNIFNFLNKNPGIHLRELSRQMKIPKTTLKHHLKYLSNQGIITSKTEVRFKRYYVTNKFGKKEKEILTLLRQEVPHNILLYMTFFIVCSEKELSKALDKNPATIDFHLKKLKDLGIIKKGWGDKKKIFMKTPIVVKRKIKLNEKIYYIDGEEYFYIILKLLNKYKKSLPNQDFINEILKLTQEYYYIDRFKKRISQKNLFLNIINNPDGAIDAVWNIFWDICPNPYHV